MENKFKQGTAALNKLDFKQAREDFSWVKRNSPNTLEGFKAELEINEIDYQERWFKGEKRPVLKGIAYNREIAKFNNLSKKLDKLATHITPLEEAKLRKRLGDFFAGLKARQYSTYEFEKAASRLPENSQERLYLLPKLAMEYHFWGKEDISRKYMEEAESVFSLPGIDADYEQAFQFGQAYFHMQKDDQAEKWLLTARGESPIKEPTEMTQELMLSRIYLQRNDIPKAIESLKIFTTGLNGMKSGNFYRDRLFGMMLTYWRAGLPASNIEMPVLTEAVARLNDAQKAFYEDDLDTCIKELEDLIKSLQKGQKKSQG
ncbi:MAG: hypothetical protein M1269_00915 [Chloroflexi bacterium]|nr:hypothetical protein [Chloroflexota bacterium]